MGLWKTANNEIHDDMDGAALSLPNWPRDMTQITDVEADQIRAAQQAALPPIIDVDGFTQAVKTGVGGILAANALMIDYPAFFPAIQSGEWNDLHDLIIDAKNKNIITLDQYNIIKSAASQFNIPIIL